MKYTRCKRLKRSSLTSCNTNQEEAFRQLPRRTDERNRRKKNCPLLINDPGSKLLKFKPIVYEVVLEVHLRLMTLPLSDLIMKKICFLSDRASDHQTVQCDGLSRTEVNVHFTRFIRFLAGTT